MEIKIRNYRGIERADIVLEPIALVAGRNGQGKSSIAQAVAAVLTGIAIVVPGVAKKDAKKLVRDGADEGGVLLTNGNDSFTISYPKCDVTGPVDRIATEFAAGLGHVFDLKPDERARVLADYIKAMPAKAAVIAAMLDIGYSQETAERGWTSVSASWDDTWAKAREYGTKEKGKWEGITGEAYGSKKAAEWKPAALTEDDWERQTLVDHAAAAKQSVDAAVGGAAVSQAEVERLKKLVADAAGAEDIVPVMADLEKTRESLALKRAEREAMPSETGVQTKNEQKPCPACGVELVIEKVYNEPTKLSVFSAEAAAAAMKHDNRKERAKLDGSIAGLKAAVATLEGRYETAKRLTDNGRAAAARLEEIGSEIQAASPSAIDEARTALRFAEDRLKAFDAKVKADELHAGIAKNEKLIAMLAPDGLRRQSLAKALGAFNERLAALSTTAGWPAVRLDESLGAHYGARPVGSVSKSEQWRARAVVQIAMAQLDGSGVVVIDDAETMIDAQSRGGLFTAIASAGLRALVCFAFATQERVPRLVNEGGRSYWVAEGVCSPL